MPRQIRLDLIRLQIPYLHPQKTISTPPSLQSRERKQTYLERTVLARTNQQPRIRTPRKPVHRRDVAPEGSDVLPRTPVPHPYAVVPRGGGGPPPVWAERDVRDLALVARQARRGFWFSCRW